MNLALTRFLLKNNNNHSIKQINIKYHNRKKLIK